MERCLYCYKELKEGQVDYHPACARKLFGTRQAPQWPYVRSEIGELAKQEMCIRDRFLGAAILIWMYHGFYFSRVWEVLDGGMYYGWMSVSLVFGVFTHIFRGWRRKLTLAPLREHPKTSDCVYAIFVSYAANLVVPRVGEISRCGVLAKYCLLYTSRCV